MELQLSRQGITINETVFEGRIEQPVECDALLPDYCPDIVKVLKCALLANIGNSSISGERLTIEGTAIANFFYTSAEGAIRRAEYKIPFAKSIELKGAPVNPLITVTPSVDYVNCRAVNQRRVDIRGAITMAVRVSSRRQQDIVRDAENAESAGLQIRSDLLPATDLVGHVRHDFSLAEDLELGHGKGQIGQVIRCEGRATLQDFKVVAGKVVAKGEFSLHILYQPLDTASPYETMKYSLPISQIIDCDGVDEQSLVLVQFLVSACDVAPKASESGEFSLLSLDARITAQISAHRNAEIQVASDCYSTRFESGCKRQNISFIRLVDMISDTLQNRATLDLPEDVLDVLDAWCEVDNVTHKAADEGLEIAMRLTVSMFARMKDDSILYFDQATEISKVIPLENIPFQMNFEPTVSVAASSFSLMGGDKIELRSDILVTGSVYGVIRHEAITEITVDSSKEKQNAQRKLIIYYADPGESVWDIAKHYNTSANAIWIENGIEQDLLPAKQMLMIPILH